MKAIVLDAGIDSWFVWDITQKNFRGLGGKTKTLAQVITKLYCVAISSDKDFMALWI